MAEIMKKLLLGTAGVAAAAVSATPAHAGDDAAYAIVGGIVGLGLGALIASDHHHYDGYGTYGHYHGPPPRYYGAGPYAPYPGYGGYYGGYSGYGYGPPAYRQGAYSGGRYPPGYDRYPSRSRCYWTREEDPETGDPVDVQICR